MIKKEIEKTPLSERINRIGTTYDILKQAANQYGDKIALQYVPDPQSLKVSQEYSFLELFSNVNKMAHLFLANGVKPNDSVTIIMPNMPENFIALAAAEAIAIASPICYVLPNELIANLLQLNQSKILVTTDELFKKMDADELLTQFDTIFIHGYSGFPTERKKDLIDYNESSDATLEVSTDFTRVSAYFHTSGTTGLLKYAKLNQQGLVYSAWLIGEMFGYTEQDVILGALPYFHVGAPTVAGYAAFLKVAKVVVASPMGWMDNAVADNFAKLVGHFKVTSFTALSFTFNHILRTLPRDANIQSLRHALSGTPLSKKDFDNFYQRTGIYPQEIYGFTESSCIAAGTKLGDPSQQGTMGEPCPYTEFDIVELNEQGQYKRSCGLNEVGVITVSGPGITPGYVMPEDENHKRFARPGWINTADLGYYDGTHYHFVARQIDMMPVVKEGKTVYLDPKKAETLISEHAAVKQVAVVGSLKPVAFVSLHAGETIDEQALLLTLKNTLSTEDIIPEEIRVCDNLPTNGMGKILKFILKEMVDAVPITQQRGLS